MDEPLPTSPDANEVEELRAELNQLVSVVRLSLSGLLVLTLSLALFVYRQNDLLYHQLQAQAPLAADASKKNQEILALVAEFQKFGAAHPDYANNVLSKFNLPVLSAKPGSPASVPAKK
jgi:hypothetical protein